MQTAQQLIDQLGLQPHYEGGWYRFVWKNQLTATPPGFAGPRSLTSVIYYLLQRGERSRRHRLLGDEFWFWHAGGTLEMLLAQGDDTPSRHLLGGQVATGCTPMVHVPKNWWQTTTVAQGDYALVSCVVSPGFEDEDFFLPPGERL